MLVLKIIVRDKLKGKTPMLCLFIFEGSENIPKLRGITAKNTRIVQSALDMRGKFGEIALVPTPEKPYSRILLAGLGKKRKLDADSIRFVSGKIAQKARDLRLKEFTIAPPPESIIDTDVAVSQIVEGSKMSLYRFEHFKSTKMNREPNIVILAQNPNDISKTVTATEIVSEAVIYTRNIANMPPNACPPSVLARIAKQLAKRNELKCTVISKAQLATGGFGGITAVGQGSKNEPNLIILEYGGDSKNVKPTVLVGKAVTFDTGGVSLKSSDAMTDMKFDKCGGCTVLGIMKAASELKLPVNLVGIIPAVENMPGAESYRPDDIITLYNGKTAEILNTDAEGRLILADALSYGEEQYDPLKIIDFATLTGACVVALGNNIAGMVSNNDTFAQDISNSSVRTAEKVWRLPLDEDYMDMIKSDVADMKNMGIGRAAGTITAAAFLKNAIEDTPWVHLDIAGVAWTQKATKEKPYNPRGATGFGVRLVLDYLLSTANTRYSYLSNDIPPALNS